jgi:hypothetical protein
LFNWWYVYFVWLLEYLSKKLIFTIKPATIVLNKVKSYSAFLRMLLVCIGGYLKSVLRYKFWILNFEYLSSRPSIFTWTRMWGSVVVFRSRNGFARKESLGNTAIDFYSTGVHFVPLPEHWMLWGGRVLPQTFRQIQGDQFDNDTTASLHIRSTSSLTDYPNIEAWGTDSIVKFKKSTIIPLIKVQLFQSKLLKKDKW